MAIVLPLTGFFAALGIGYFCIDAYRHRNRALSRSDATYIDSNLTTGLDVVPFPYGNDLYALEQTASEASHAVGESAEAASQGLVETVEAIAQALSHHH